RLPEGEVAGITLALVDLDARAGEKLVEVLAGEPSVRREPPDLEVHVAVHRVGEPLGDEALDERDHLGDVQGGLRLDIGRRNADRRHVLAERLDVTLGEFRGRHALGIRPSDDPVVHVREVPDERDAVALEAEVPLDDVEHHRAPRVANVGEVVHRHTTHVDAHVAGGEGRELLLAPRQRVVDLDAHAATSTLATAIAAMPSRRPRSPSPSGLLAFTLTRSMSSPSVSASRLAIPSRCGASRGASASTVASTLTSRPPREVTSSTTRRSSARLEIPRYRGSPSGKWRPRSPSASAPRSASAIACVSTSASEWPSRPRALGTVTPPRTSGRPSTSGWRSNPRPTRVTGPPGRAPAGDPRAW